MRFFLRDPSARLAVHLPYFKRLPLSYESTAGLPETVLSTSVSSARYDLRECDLGFLFRYEVFPPSILKFFGEWQREDREMRVGDTIVQQAQIPPACGVHLVFGVRVVNVEHGAQHAGFSYGTLRGHPETGVNAFSIARVKGGIDAIVRTTAVPGLPLSRFLARVFTNQYVIWCNRRALARMAREFVKANP